MFDFLLDSISDSPATYLALAGIIFVDDFVPFAPGDTAMITAGILAANGELMLVLVIAAGAVGGILGDNLFYFLGRRFGPGIAGRLFAQRPRQGWLPLDRAPRHGSRVDDRDRRPLHPRRPHRDDLRLRHGRLSVSALSAR